MVNFLKNNTSMEVFKLNNNGLGPWGGNVIASALAENADKRKAEGREGTLRVVVCGRNRLENGSATAWADAFAKHGGLEEVTMKQNGIRMEGIAALAEGLSKNSKLAVLDLQDNTATKTGTRSIVKHLATWPSLRVLNLSDCILGNAGGIALATSLSVGSNPKLETLSLQYGEFDKRTVELLALAVSQHLSGLTTVELNGNKFDAEDDCVEELKKALALHGNEDALDECEWRCETRVTLLIIVDDMEEVDEDEEDSEEDEEEEDEDEDEKEGGEDDGVDKGADGADALPPATDKQTDEWVLGPRGSSAKTDSRLADLLEKAL